MTTQRRSEAGQARPEGVTGGCSTTATAPPHDAQPRLPDALTIPPGYINAQPPCIVTPTHFVPIAPARDGGYSPTEAAALCRDHYRQTHRTLSYHGTHAVTSDLRSRPPEGVRRG